MPITKSAKKSLRVSQKRRAQNLKRETALQKAARTANDKNLNEVISLIDKAAKTNLIHRNKASRLKSQLAKKFAKTEAKKAAPKKKVPAKKTAKIKK